MRVGREIEGRADGRDGGPRELSLLSELQVVSILARAGESTNDLALVTILRRGEPHIQQMYLSELSLDTHCCTSLRISLPRVSHKEITTQGKASGCFDMYSFPIIHFERQGQNDQESG